MKSIDIFKKVYNDDTLFGGRVSKSELNEKFKDTMFVDEAIAKLFVECPTKFPGDLKNEKHYLLKPFWQIYRNFIDTIWVCQHKGMRGSDSGWTYVRYFIIDLLYFWSDWRWYMHPTAVSRHGRFFLTPKINF